MWMLSTLRITAGKRTARAILSCATSHIPRNYDVAFATANGQSKDRSAKGH